MSGMTDKELVGDFIASLRHRLSPALPAGRYVVSGRIHLKRKSKRRAYRFRTRLEGAGEAAPHASREKGAGLLAEFRSLLPGLRSELLHLVRDSLREVQAKAPDVEMEAVVGDVKIPVDDVSAMLDELKKRGKG